VHPTFLQPSTRHLQTARAARSPEQGRSAIRCPGQQRKRRRHIRPESSRGRASPSKNRSHSALRKRRLVDEREYGGPFLGATTNSNVRVVRVSVGSRSWLRSAFSAAGVPADHPIDRSYLARAALMCLLCSHTARRSSDRDPITGLCVAQKACAKRREDLDNWTIKELGLIPRTRKRKE
jgi:hypothetical protein